MNKRWPKRRLSSILRARIKREFVKDLSAAIQSTGSLSKHEATQICLGTLFRLTQPVKYIYVEVTVDTQENGLPTKE